jgi:hypothetical protein
MSEYNQIFILPDGEEIKVRDDYMGRFLAIPIQRIYTDPEDQVDNQLMEERWKNLDCRKIEVHKSYVKKGEQRIIRHAVETMIIAEKKNWTEYPLVKTYDAEFCYNHEYYTKVEVVLITDNYSRRLYFDWNGEMNAYDFMQNITDRIVEAIIENPSAHHAVIEDEYGPIIFLEFYTNDGEHCKFELYGDRDIERMIASVRVVEFTQTIVE